MKRRALFSMLFVLLLSLTGESWAQFAQRGAMQGAVSDPSGALIPKANVTLIQLGQHQTRQITTDAQGHYEFDNLVAGQYLITVTAQGFSTAKSEGVTVNIGSTTTYDFKLQTGSVSQTVTVTTEGGGLQTDQVGVSTDISARQMEELPLNGQNFTSVQALVPGLSTYPAANVIPGGTFSVGAQFAFGGIAASGGGTFEGSRDTGYYINGVDVNDNYESSTSFAPSSEALGTGTASVTNYSAAVGRDYASLSMQTKGGSDKFHGEGYEFLENTDLNATKPYSKLLQTITQTPAVKQSLIRNEFGGNLGGPIYIPKMLPSGFKDRLFFFVNYEKLLEHDGSSLYTASVPSAAERTGNYSELLGSNPAPAQLYNPFYTTYVNGNSSRPAILNNRLDLATKPDGSPLIDPNAVKLLNATVPLPNVTGVPSNQINYTGYKAESISTSHLDTRFDARITSKDSVFVTWSQSKGLNQFSGGPQPYQLYNTPTQDQSYLVTANYAHIFTPKLSNEFTFGIGDGWLLYGSSATLSYDNGSSNPFNQYLQNTGVGQEHGVLTLGITNYASPGNSGVFRDENESLQFSDNFNWDHGKHSLSAGFNYIRKTELDWGFDQAVGFTGAFSHSGSNLSYVGGDASADALMGLPQNIAAEVKVANQPATIPGSEVAFPSYGVYVNDLFRLNTKFTISAGLRYDLNIPVYSPSPTTQLCCAVYVPDANGGAEAFPGIAPGISQHYLAADKKDVSPRLSIIFSPDQKTVVRAGYGIFFVSGSSDISNFIGELANGGNGLTAYSVTNATLGAPVDTPVMTLASIMPPTLYGAVGSFPVSTGPGEGYYGSNALSSITYMDQKSTTQPYYQRMMFDIQQALGSHDTVTIGYAGTQGRKGLNQMDINLPPYKTGWSSGGGVNDPAFNAARPNNSGRFSDIYAYRNNLNSHYNALIAQYSHHFSRGFEITSHYTWSRSVSDYPHYDPLRSNGAPGGGGSGFLYPNLYSRGQSVQSHPQRFVFSWVWAPKYGETWSRFAKESLTGWRLSGILSMESGSALTVSNNGSSRACSPADAGTPRCPTGRGTSPKDGAGTSELNVSGNPNIGHFSKTPLRQFDTSAFSIPANGVRGDSGLGTVRGPGQNNLDVSLAKTFPVYEWIHVELRADAFNALNHSQWTSMNTAYPATNAQLPFGMVSASREGRIGQGTFKVIF
jgi:hypothetical protein